MNPIATLKVGSVLHVPVPQSWVMAGVDHPDVLTMVIVSGVLTVTAIKAGSAWCTITQGGAFLCNFLVSVT